MIRLIDYYLKSISSENENGRSQTVVIRLCTWIFISLSKSLKCLSLKSTTLWFSNINMEFFFPVPYSTEAETHCLSHQ